MRTTGSAVAKALGLIKILAAADGAMRLVDMAQMAGLRPGTAHRILAELVALGFVARSGDRYHLGIEAVRIGVSPALPAVLQQVARPFLDVLVQRTGMLAGLQMLESDGCRVVEVVRPARYSGIVTLRGELLPAHRATGGLVLLAYLEPADRAPYLAAVEEQSRDVLSACLDEIRAQAIVYVPVGPNPLTAAVAVPILTPRGQCICSLFVAGLHSDLVGERITLVKDALRAVACALQQHLSSNPDFS